MTSTISLRLDTEVKMMALKGYESDRAKYDSPSHFVRCAVIKLYNKEVAR